MVGIHYSKLYSLFWPHLPFSWNVTFGVPNTMEAFFVGRRGRDPYNLSGVQLAQQFMKLNSFICVTGYLSDNLKIWHQFPPATYTNQKFWFHLCYIPRALTVLKVKWYALFYLILLRFFRKDSITEDFVGYAGETHWQAMLFYINGV